MPPNTRTNTTPAPAATSAPAQRPGKAVVSWVDAETDAVLFTDLDIVRFDWTRQIFQLTRDRAMDLMSRPPALSRDFVVFDHHGEIYRGCFMSSGSSIGYDGPTIRDDYWQPASRELRPPLYRIDGGYPVGGGSRDAARFSPRLKEALQTAGVLCRTNDPDKVTPIKITQSEWQGERYKFRVLMVAFLETFCLDRDARFILRFYTGDKFDLDPDELQAGITLTANGGRFGLARTVDIPLSVLGRKSPPFQGVFSCRGKLWGPVFGAMDTFAKPGPGELAVTVIARKKTTKGWETIRSWRIPPQKVQILPAAAGPAKVTTDQRKNKKEVSR